MLFPVWYEPSPLLGFIIISPLELNGGFSPNHPLSAPVPPFHTTSSSLSITEVNPSSGYTFWNHYKEVTKTFLINDTFSFSIYRHIIIAVVIMSSEHFFLDTFRGELYMQNRINHNRFYYVVEWNLESVSQKTKSQYFETLNRKMLYNPIFSVPVPNHQILYIMDVQLLELQRFNRNSEEHISSPLSPFFSFCSQSKTVH